MPNPEYNLGKLVEWKKTEGAIERVQDSPLYEEKDATAPHGYFSGRRIIARDAGINRGISMGDSKRELIVVDDEKFPQLKEVYEGLFKKRRQELLDKRERTKTGTAETLDLVYRYVLDLMPYDSKVAKEFSDKYADQKVSLTVFLDRKGGECRHQALLAGYLIERMVKEKLLKGKVAINRNFVKVLGGHSWVKYVDKNDETYIVDPAQKFCGTLEEAKENASWFYEEPKKLN